MRLNKIKTNIEKAKEYFNKSKTENLINQMDEEAWKDYKFFQNAEESEKSNFMKERRDYREEYQTHCYECGQKLPKELQG